MEDGQPALQMNCPDLIKEHLVLRLAFEQGTLDLLPQGWHLEPDRFRFLRRLWLDCPNRLKDQSGFWDRFFSDPPASGLLAWFYAELLGGCTHIFPPLAPRAMEALAVLYEANSRDEEIAECYAIGLFNLSCDQTPEGRATTLVRLEALYADHPGIDEIAVAYAKGLLILTLDQDEANIPNTVANIAAFLREHPGAIPEFRDTLDKPLSLCPEFIPRYQPLLEL